MSQIDHVVKQETTTVLFPFYIILTKIEINRELQRLPSVESFCKLRTRSLFTQRNKQKTYTRFNLKLATTW